MRFLRGVAGRVLSCGCLIGVYETYEGQVVATIDAHHPACANPMHELHASIALLADGTLLEDSTPQSAASER